MKLHYRKWHKIIGVILVLPMIGWAITGTIFFIKPGYQQAYQSLGVQTYPLSAKYQITPKTEWQRFELVKTVLGEHLLVTTKTGKQHLNPENNEILVKPDDKKIKRLIEDAIKSDIERYGEITSYKNDKALTSTGVNITLNWDSLSLRQEGKDTRLINTLYKIHYLQWTPHKEFNQVLGIFGLVLIVLITALGVKMILRTRKG